MERSSEERINENLMINSKIFKLVDKCLYKIIKSICKIITSKSVGSGFLIKLYKGYNEFYCLMTNEHLIEK